MLTLCKTYPDCATVVIEIAEVSPEGALARLESIPQAA
jgi:hypothetical protein